MHIIFLVVCLINHLGSSPILPHSLNQQVLNTQPSDIFRISAFSSLPPLLKSSSFPYTITAHPSPYIQPGSPPLWSLHLSLFCQSVQDKVQTPIYACKDFCPLALLTPLLDICPLLYCTHHFGVSKWPGGSPNIPYYPFSLGFSSCSPFS